MSNKEENSLEVVSKSVGKMYKRKGVTVYKHFVQKLKEIGEEGDSFDSLHLNEEGTGEQVKVMFDCLGKGKVELKSLRLWGVGMGDVGCEGLGLFMMGNEVEVLDLMNNGITEKGCRLIGKALESNPNYKIKRLMMDHNSISDEGMRWIMKGLRRNRFIEEISFSYCQLSDKSAEYLQQLIMFVGNGLQRINIQGNQFHQSGFHQIMRALECNQVVKELNIKDNQILMEFDQFKKTLENNSTLRVVDLENNGVSQAIAEEILGIQKVKKQTRVYLTNRYQHEFATQYFSFMNKLQTKKKKRKQLFQYRINFFQFVLML